MSHPLPAVRRVAIVGGNRIPFARSNTAYASASNQDMLTFTLQGLVDRFNLHGVRLGEVAAGAVIKHSRDFNLTRESLLSTTLAKETPACDVQQACGTGLEAAILVANKIALGQIEAGIAGGVDTTSDAPVGVSLSAQVKLPTASASKGIGTGKTDVAVGGELFKRLGRVTPYLDLAYTMPGSPAGYRLDDSLSGQIGAAVQIGKRVRGHLGYAYAQAISPTLEDQQSLAAGINVGVTRNVTLAMYGSVGVSRGAPDVVAGMQMGFGFD